MEAAFLFYLRNQKILKQRFQHGSYETRSLAIELFLLQIINDMTFYKKLPSNFIKSSNLVLGTAVLGLINLLLSRDILTDVKNIAIAILTLLFIIGLGFLIRQGQNWVKYLLLVLTIVGTIGIPFIITNITEKPLIGIINLAQTVMQIWATILLFKVPKP